MELAEASNSYVCVEPTYTSENKEFSIKQVINFDNENNKDYSINNINDC